MMVCQMHCLIPQKKSVERQQEGDREIYRETWWWNDEL